nr:hypothetical protein [Tanacetum cinerariifolium]
MEMDMWEIKEKLAERWEQMAFRAYEEDKRQHRASMEAYIKVHNETVRSELRMAIVQQSMEMDMWEIKEKLAERREQMAFRAYE